MSTCTVCCDKYNKTQRKKRDLRVPIVVTTHVKRVFKPIYYQPQKNHIA